MVFNNPPIGWLAAVPIIVDRQTLEAMAAGGPPEIDVFLRSEMKNLRLEYAVVGNPRAIYLAGKSIAAIIAPLRGSECSFQFSKLQAFLGELLLAYGKDRETLLTAIQHLEYAVDILQKVDEITSENLIHSNVSYCLLLAVAKKALGRFDESLKGMRITARNLVWNNFATVVDLVPLRRQEVMMYQTVSGHRDLAEEAVRYIRYVPSEYYRTLKRVFEFILNKGALKEADMLFPEFRRSFTRAARHLPPISHVSFLKNIGQYLMAKGRRSDALLVFNRCILEATQRNLHGQVHQVRILIQELEAGSTQGGLVTFRVSHGV